jgi:hypothetical protein
MLHAIARRVIARRHGGNPSELAIEQAAFRMAQSIVTHELVIELEPFGEDGDVGGDRAHGHGEVGLLVVIRYSDGLSAVVTWRELDVDPRGVPSRPTPDPTRPTGRRAPFRRWLTGG